MNSLGRTGPNSFSGLWAVGGFPGAEYLALGVIRQRIRLSEQADKISGSECMMQTRRLDTCGISGPAGTD